MGVTLSVDLALPLDEARAALLDELAGVEGVELELEATEGGTKATLTLAPELEARELAGWFASLVRAARPEAYDDWFTDRVARRPSGAQAREVYADPLYHWPNFRAIMRSLPIAADPTAFCRSRPWRPCARMVSTCVGSKTVFPSGRLPAC